MPRTVRLGTVTLLEDRLAPAAGEIDTSFGTGGKALAGFGGGAIAHAAATQIDGKIVVVGEAPGVNGTDFGIARFNANGTLDTTFGLGGRAVVPFDLGGTGSSKNDVAYAMAVQPDGKIVVAGSAATGTSSSSSAAAVVRLTKNGILDTTFGAGGLVTFSFLSTFNREAVRGVAITADNRILLGGFTRFSFASNDADFAAARLMSDGTFDTSLSGNGKLWYPVNESGGRLDEAYAVAALPDGRFLLAGVVENGVGNLDFGVVRFNSSGSVDTSFNNNTTGTTPGEVFIGFNLGGNNADRARAIALLPDGRMLVAGSAAVSAANTADFAVTRLNRDGTIDPSFGVNGRTTVGFNLGGGGADEAHAVLVQPDGKYMLVGSAGQGSGADFGAVRLTTDGAVDTTFGSSGKVLAPGGGTNSPGALGATFVLTDTGVIMVGGNGTDMMAYRVFGDPLPTSGPSEEVEETGPSSPPPSGPRRFAPADVPPTGPVLVGGRADGTARVLIGRGGGYLNRSVLTFFPGTAVDVRTAVADVTGDGVEDFIGGTGPGVANEVAVIDGATGTRISGWRPFEDTFTGGVFVAAADLDGDGVAEVIVTPDRGGGPVVALFNGGGAERLRFYGIEDPAFRGGARVAVGDVNADGVPDLIVSAGFLGGARIAVLDGRDVGAGSVLPRQLVADFFAFEPSLRNGAFVAAGDMDGDGFADLAFGGGPDGAPRVRVVSGRALLAAGPFGTLDELGTGQLANFFAGDAANRGGVRLTMRDADDDGRADLLVGSGEGEESRVRLFYAANLLHGRTESPSQELDPFAETLTAGVFVG